MLLPTLAAWHVTLFTVLFIIAAVVTMLVILIQKPRGGGLAGAFGGAGGSSQSVFGAKTGDVLTWFTVICFTLFIALAMLLTWFANPSDAINPPSLDNATPTDTTPSPSPSPSPSGGTGTNTGAGTTPAPTTDGKAADSKTSDSTPATGTGIDDKTSGKDTSEGATKAADDAGK